MSSPDDTSKNFHVRPCAVEDLDAVLLLNEAEVPRVSSLTSTQLLWFAQQPTQFIVANDAQSRLVGFVVALGTGSTYSSPNYRWFHERYSDFMYIDRLVVAKPARRLGLASAFYAHLEALARADAKKSLCCEVNVRPHNPESLSFHQRQGFADLAERDSDDGHKRVVYLQKILGADDRVQANVDV